jgi:hypothetical protein
MDHRIDARIAALEAEIGSLKALLAKDGEASPPTSDRRGMVKLMAVSAVGAVTGAALLGAQPAAAVQGDPVLDGLSNDAQSATILNASDDSALIVNSAVSWGIEVIGGAHGNALFRTTLEPPQGTEGTAGSLLVDVNGDWWAATLTQGDGRWIKLAGPTTAGQLHILPAPVRVYDSRPGSEPVGVGPKAPTAINGARTIDTTQNASTVPPEANGVLITLTIVAPTSGGFATAWPDGIAPPATSSINFGAGQNIATTTVSGCGPGAKIQVLANSVTDFIVDVIGYYQ